VYCHFCSPPLTPPPLSTPAGVERGAWIWWLASGYASTARGVATASSLPDWQAHGRREIARICTPRLAATPASNETCPSCLVHSQSRSDRCRWHTQISPFTTTASVKCRRPNRGGDASLHRSLSKTPTAKSRPPSLPPAGGTEQRRCRCVPIRGKTARTRDRACLGRGGEWGERKSLPIQRLSQKKKKT